MRDNMIRVALYFLALVMPCLSCNDEGRSVKANGGNIVYPKHWPQEVLLLPRGFERAKDPERDDVVQKLGLQQDEYDGYVLDAVKRNYRQTAVVVKYNGTWEEVVDEVKEGIKGSVTEEQFNSSSADSYHGMILKVDKYTIVVEERSKYDNLYCISIEYYDIEGS